MDEFWIILKGLFFLIGIPAMIALPLRWLFKTREINVTCDWCGTNFRLTKDEYRKRKRNGIYCTGRCRRSDESSTGIKEKRVRWIDHE